MKRKNSKTKKIEGKAQKTTIVKRGWHVEPYDEKKVYGSCVFACRMVHLTQIQSEKIAEKATITINKQAQKKKFISSNDIFQMIISELEKYSEDASFMYKTHRDIS